MSDPVLQACSLGKTFHSGDFTLDVLKELELSVAAGEFVSIQGESGCGKTTLLNLLAGIEYPDSGCVKWDGESLAGMRRNALARQRGRFLGIVFQSYYLVPEIDTLQNVLLGARIMNGKPSAAVRQRAETLLDRVGLLDRCSQLPNTLSGGERQRVAIARALLVQPKVVLADEPTGNLDEGTGIQVLELLEELCRDEGASLVLVTHNVEHAARADRQLYLSHGKISPLSKPISRESE